MKTKDCLKRTIRIVGIGIKKATSYKVVKGRLANGLYSDEFLQDRIQHEKQKATNA